MQGELWSLCSKLCGYLQESRWIAVWRSLLWWWVRSVWIHLQLLIRIVRQYRVKYRQGRTAGDRQRQGRVPGRGSVQAASKHSSGETIRGWGRQKTIRITGNFPRSSTQKSNMGIKLRKDSQGKLRLWKESVCVCVCVCVCQWAAGVDDQSVPGMRNDGNWSPNGDG